MILSPLLVALALGACGGEAPAPTPAAASQPDWNAVVIFDPDGEPTFHAHAQDIARAGARLGVYVAVFPGPDGARVPILGDPQSDGSLEVVHMLDLSTVGTSRAGWLLAERDKTPLFVEPGTRSDFAAAATRYFEQDFAAALPWRVVVGIDRTQEATFELYLDRIARVLADAEVQVVPWRKNDPTPVRFPAEGENAHTLDPTTMTQAETGWIFAEEGRTPVYQPPAKVDEVLKAATRYFRVAQRAGGVGLAVRGDGAAGGRGGRTGKRVARKRARQGGAAGGEE